MRALVRQKDDFCTFPWATTNTSPQMAESILGFISQKAPTKDRITQTNTTEDLQTTSIEKLPYDILHLIFQEIDLEDATCLGLAAPALYRKLKVFHSKPIPLTIIFRFQDVGNLIAWKGFAGYRFVEDSAWIFVKKFKPLKYDNNLIARFRDHHRSLGYVAHNGCFCHSRNHRKLICVKEPSHPLPSPINMGDDWERAVFRVIEESWTDTNFTYADRNMYRINANSGLFGAPSDVPRQEGDTEWSLHWRWFEIYFSNIEYWEKFDAFMKSRQQESAKGCLALIKYLFGRGPPTAARMDRLREKALKKACHPKPAAQPETTSEFDSISRGVEIQSWREWRQKVNQGPTLTLRGKLKKLVGFNHSYKDYQGAVHIWE